MGKDAQRQPQPWYDTIPPDLRTAIEQQSCVVWRRHGAPIYAAGDRDRGMYGIADGLVRMVLMSSNGGSSVHYAMRAPEWFGELSAFDGRPRPLEATAVGNVRLLHLSHKAFCTIVDKEPRYWSYFATLMADHFRQCFDRLEAIALRPAKERVAEALLNLFAEGENDREAGYPQRISQEDLAAMAGISRQTVSKVLKQFESERLISLGYHCITLLNRAAIRAMAF